MTAKTRIKRFSIIDRMFHLFLMLTFLIQTATGVSRLFITTVWGKKLNVIFGGYETSLLIHKRIGILMIACFVIHTLYLLSRINWKDLGTSIFGPDSLVPNLQDFKDLWQRTMWLFGLGSPPKLGRWTYWEKFDYWAVFWGMPLLAITGLMLMYPLLTSRFMPGWILNVAALLHRAEAILAVTYIFIVHFFIGHLRPSSFPMNEAMFSGSVSMEEAMEEKPSWIARLKEDGKLELSHTNPPVLWYRALYYIFGYAALVFGIYLLINGIIYSRYITLH
ncbi:MAG: cytochrome b/b6 domain-containing protein [Deltaproteobacteria bacterium]|nr:cytochrome b/b6 domain-containing protein [Deltaproteobacteria bacterium]